VALTATGANALRSTHFAAVRDPGAKPSPATPPLSSGASMVRWFGGLLELIKREASDSEIYFQPVRMISFWGKSPTRKTCWARRVCWDCGLLAVALVRTACSGAVRLRLLSQQLHKSPSSVSMMFASCEFVPCLSLVGLSHSPPTCFSTCPLVVHGNGTFPSLDPAKTAIPG
jgi:hypothetical protein